MGKIPALGLVYCLIAVMLAGCSPTAPSNGGKVAGFSPATQSPMATPSAGTASATPSPAEVQAFQQQIVDVHRDVLQVLQHMAGLSSEQQQQIGGMMVDLMSEEIPLLAAMQPVQGLMTPQEREVADANVRRIGTNIRDMYALMPVTTPGAMNPDPMKGGPTPQMGEMGSQMDELHRRMLAQLPQMSIPRIQGVAANMVDLAGNLNRLKVPLGSAFARLEPEQRSKLIRQLDAMRAITTQMVQATLIS